MTKALISVFLASFILFAESASYYFFQDDWFVLNWVRSGDFLSFFTPRTDIIYWRPISMPLLFFTMDKLFPLNPLAFHLVAFFLFGILIFLVYKLLIALGFDQKLSTLGAFLYGTWPIHYISLSWLSTTSYIIGPIFQILSFLFFISFLKTGKVRSYLASFTIFLLALASSEFTLVLPVIFALYPFFLKEKIQIKYILPFLAVDLAYIFVRFILFPIPAGGDYQLSADTKLLNNYLWYILWGFNFPETFKYLIFPSLPRESFKILLDFWQVTLPAILLLIFSTARVALRAIQELKIFLIGLAWFTIGLLPVIFLAKHSYPLYLSFAGIGMILILISSFKKAPTYLTLGFIVLWLIASFSTLNFTKDNHWIKNEQAVSRAYVDYVLATHAAPPQNSVFIFKPPNITFSENHDIVIVEGEDTIKLALSDQNAMQVIFAGISIKSIFSSHQQKVNLPEGLPSFEVSPVE